jgi:hypothetical protein
MRSVRNSDRNMQTDLRTDTGPVHNLAIHEFGVGDQVLDIVLAPRRSAQALSFADGAHPRPHRRPEGDAIDQTVLESRCVGELDATPCVHRSSRRAGCITKGARPVRRAGVRNQQWRHCVALTLDPYLISFYPPPSSGLTRDHTARGPEVRQPEYFALPKSAGRKPRPVANCLGQRAEGNLDRDSQITSCRANSITP